MNKPLPTPNADSKPYWDACANERLMYQRCLQCERAQFYPRAICTHCGSDRMEWRESSGRGTVYALTQVHIGLPSFKAESPYAIVLVEMEEGFRILMNVVGSQQGLAIDSRGHVIFEAREDVKLPQFQLDL